MRKGVQHLSWTAAVDESKVRFKKDEYTFNHFPHIGTFMLNIKAFLRAYRNRSCEGSIEATRWVVIEAQYTSDQVLASVGGCIKYN